MSLPLPNLDDRRWIEMVEEARALIPFYAPEWTDHNIHDPGITLMELLAWVTEMDIYQLNRIPGKHKRKFLSLIGIQPELPHPARTVLSFKQKTGNSLLELPATLEFEGRDPFGQTTPFRILNGINIFPGDLSAVQFKDQRGFHDLTERWKRGEPINIFGDNPKPGVELYLGFSQALISPVSLFFIFSNLLSNEEEREYLIQEIEAWKETCPPHLFPTCEEELLPPDIVTKEDNDYVETTKTLVHHSVKTVWEFLNDRGEWQTTNQNQVEDNTRNFTLNGCVIINLWEFLFLIDLKYQNDLNEFVLPEDLYQQLEKNQVFLSKDISIEKKNDTWFIFDADNNLKYSIKKEETGLAIFQLLPMVKQRLGQIEPEYYYIRCRFISGAYEKAPVLKNLVLNGVIAEQAVPEGDFKMQIPDNPGIQTKFLGKGTGYPNQQIILSEKPVPRTDFRLFTIEDGTWREWALQQDFDVSRKGDFHFLLDPTDGIITFGDGENGRVVPAGFQIVGSYFSTRAEEGNIAEKTIKKLADSFHNNILLNSEEKKQFEIIEITNPIPAAGRSSIETVDHATGRAVELIEKTNRAITLTDCETLVRQIPGVRLARVSAFANLHPGFPCIIAPGIITIIILPYLPADKPVPSKEVIRYVSAYVARRRIIGTRIEVVGPEYLDIAIRAKVQSYKGTNKSDVQNKIIENLNRFFHPIEGGFDGKGWPFGRDVYRSEILQLIDETAGVDHVLSLDIIAGNGDPQCSNICLGRTGLVAVGNHKIEVV